MNKAVYNAVIGSRSDHNIDFGDFQNLVVDLGFTPKRKRGSHQMYYNSDTKEFMNIQKDGNKAKAYQVEQLRRIIRKHGL